MEVDSSEYRTANAPEELYAYLGPCIGVGAVYSGKGYLLRTQPVGWKKFAKELAPMLRDLAADVADKSQLKIYVAGCSLDGECEEEMLAGRRIVLEEIAKAGFRECLNPRQVKTKSGKAKECFERVKWAKRFRRRSENLFYLFIIGLPNIT